MDTFTGVVFRKNRDHYITSMTCYVHLTVNITNMPKYDRIKEIHNLATVILSGGIDFSYGKKVLTLAKASGGRSTTFRADKRRRSKYIEKAEFFDVASKKTKEIYIYSPYKQLRKKGLLFLNSD